MDDSSSIGAVLAVLALVVLVVALLRTVRIVPQASVFVIERLGRYSRTLEPGLHLLVPVLDRVRVKLDVREQVVGFPPQGVITRDNLMVGVDTVLYYSITDPNKAEYAIDNYVAAIEQLVVTTLRNVVGGMALEEALTGRDEINTSLAVVLDDATGKWGIKVNRVEIRGIEPPATIRDAMEQAMRADRGKRAAILTAEGQQQSAVLSAQGEKQAAVLRAEAAKASTILAAEGEREAALLRAQGEAQAISTVVGAIKAAEVDEAVLAYQRQLLLPRLAEGSANKVWFVPDRRRGRAGQGAGHLQPAAGRTGHDGDGGPAAPGRRHRRGLRRLRRPGARPAVGRVTSRGRRCLPTGREHPAGGSPPSCSGTPALAGGRPSGRVPPAGRDGPAQVEGRAVGPVLHGAGRPCSHHSSRRVSCGSTT